MLHWGELLRAMSVFIAGAPPLAVRNGLNGESPASPDAWSLERLADLGLRILNCSGEPAFDVRVTTCDDWSSDPNRDGPWAEVGAGESIEAFVRFPSDGAETVTVTWTAAGREHRWTGPNVGLRIPLPSS